MPNLTLSVTDAQAARIQAALVARYKGTPLAAQPLAAQARDFIYTMLKDMVLGYERAEAAATAASTIADL